jgi:hypothetical protein
MQGKKKLIESLTLHPQIIYDKRTNKGVSMEHTSQRNNKNRSDSITLYDFLPLIIIFSLITIFTITKQFYYGWNLMTAMNDFMASFFIVFGSFKLVNWKGFVESYKMYDVIAQRSTLYAYAYPLIEIALGIAYFTGWQPITTNLITLFVMVISAYGVALELQKDRPIPCACLGVVFKLPMTYVTLLEDLVMACMALIMLFMHN